VSLRRRAALTLGPFCLVLLAGCAGDAAIRGSIPDDAAALAVYTMHGRFSLRHEAESVSGRISWSRRPGEEQVLLQDPFGSGVGELIQREGGASLQLADGRRYAGDDGERLLADITGLRVPLGALGVWLAGRGVDGRSVSELQRDEAGRVARFRHDGWQVEYRYREAVALPSGVQARREDGTEIRLAIDRWDLPE
jgi:outer membrane lipoprotein LolB